MSGIETITRKNRKRIVGRIATTLVCATWLSLHAASAEERNPRYQCAMLDLQAITWINSAQAQADEEPDYQAVSGEQLRAAFDHVLAARALCERGDIAQAIERYKLVIAQLSVHYGGVRTATD